MIRVISPAVVHTHSSKAGVLGRLAAAAENVPVIIHSIHGFGIEAVGNPLVRRALLAAERAAARRTTHFIAVSSQNIDAGRCWKLFGSDKVSLIHSGIKLSTYREAEYRPELLDELSIPRDAPLVGTISCFKPQKNLGLFIELAARIHAIVPEARFLIIGDGAMRGELERQIAELELENVVIVAGWRRDVPELLKLMRVSVLTSRWEGLPRVIPESLSAGVPVVVTRAGGSAEAVNEGVTGFVCEQGDSDKLFEKILFLLRDAELARKMGNAGPESVLDWDIDMMVKAQEELYQQLLDTAASAGG